VIKQSEQEVVVNDRRWWWGVVVAVVVMCGWWGVSGQARSAGPGASSGGRRVDVEQSPYVLEGARLKVRADLISKLTLSVVQETDVEAMVEGFGRVSFAPGASVGVQVPLGGYVEEVRVRVGEVVEAGDVLAVLRSGEVAKMRAELRRVQALAAVERDAQGRVKRLVDAGAAAERELAEVKARLAALQVEAQGVKDTLSASGIEAQGADRFELRVTQGGHVLERSVHPGERVGQGDVPFVIGQPQELLVSVAVAERYAHMIERGQVCGFSVSALGGAWMEGEVLSVKQALRAGSRTAEVVCAPQQIDARLRAGMIAQGRVTVRGSGGVVVPRSAVLLRRDAWVVLVRVAPDALERREVTLGAQLADQVQVLSGLDVGDAVVTQGAVLLDGELDELL
jgi:membrane fusion protein, heavy metal efflux system